MKKSYIIIVFALGLILSGCFSRDDDYYNRNVRLSITDAVLFNTKKEYLIGDTLVFELKFSRYLKEEGFTTLLDIFETTESEQFGYNFGVSKFSGFSNTFERINIDQQFILGARTDEGYSSYYGGSMAALIDADKQGYTSKVGIVLVEAGRFKIDMDFFTLHSGNGYDFENRQVDVEIEHNQTPENEMEAEFTVTEN